MNPGFVSLVGAGPGDPELLTVKALRRLQAAEVVVYDALVNEALLAECRPDAVRIFVGKRAGCRAFAQEAINALLIDLARDGKQVVRLKGGDPFVFGRGGEEALELHAAGVPFEIVPGVSSAIAAPAYAGIPVTQRGVAVSFAVVTGHEDPSKPASQINWSALAGIDTLVVLMGVGHLAEISAQLQGQGRAADTPAAVVQWGTTVDQATVVGTLATIAEDVARAGVGAPATLVVGEVVRLREQLSWFDTLTQEPAVALTEPLYVVRDS
jgi:uroporphyrin-III C-methyltransferase